MENFELIAEPRSDVGRGASRRLRKTGKIPGIIYGAAKDATSIMLNHDEIVHHLEHEAFYSHILTVKLGKDEQRVVLKDVQRHPFKPRVLHIDLQRVSETEFLTMRIPLHFINQEKCVGVKQGGGVVSHIMTEVEISCLPKDLPEYIEVDLLNLNLGDAIHLNELVLPEGVQTYAALHGGDTSATVASVHMPKVITEEEEEMSEEIAADAVPASTAKEPDEDKEEKS